MKDGDCEERGGSGLSGDTQTNEIWIEEQRAKWIECQANERLIIFVDTLQRSGFELHPSHNDHFSTSLFSREGI